MTVVSAPNLTQLWRVIVIDDSLDDRSEVRRLLLNGSERRYKFVEAETGAAGVRMILDAAGGLPDCVVLDYHLPDMDAVDVLKALAGPDGLTACPVVVLTGIVGYEQTRAVLRAGAQDYLGKGWMTPESLTRAVENAAERWAMARELKDRDAALRETNQHLQMSLNVGRAVAFNWDIPTNEVRRLHGLASCFDATTDKPETFEKMTGRVHPDDRDSFERRVRQAIERPGQEYTNDYRVVGPDGSVRWISDTGRVEFSADEKPLRLVGLGTDITDRKQAEESRHQMQRNYLALADASSEIAYRMSADWSTMLPLDGRQLVASSYQPLVDWAWLDMNLPPDEHPRVRQAISEAIAGKTLFELEHRVRCPDGSIGWTFSRAVPILDENEAVIAWFGAASDITQRKQAEEALRKSEARLRQVFESNVTGMIRWDLDNSLILDANAAFFRMTGYAREDLTNGVLNFRALTPPEWTDRNEMGIQTLRTDGVAAPYEKEYFRKDGSRVPLIIAGTRFEDSPSEGMSFLIDITDRSQAEGALRASERKLRLALEAGATGLWEWDVASNVVTWSPECYAIHGMKEGEFDGTAAGFDRLVNPDDRSRVWATVRAAVDGRTRYECEFRIVRPDGEVRWVANTGRAEYDQQGRPLGVIGTITDITERKEAEAALRESEERLGLALSGGKMGMWVWDMRSGQSVWNAMEYELLGLKEGDTSPSAELFFHHVHPEDFAPMRRSLDEVRPERPDWNYECRVFRADGVLRWLAAVGRTQYDADGRPERMFGVNFDITEHNESKAALRESEARLGGILRRSPAGIVQTDAAGCMTLVNPRWCEMLGYSEAELLGRSIIEVTHPSFVDETRTAVGSLASGGPDFQIEKAYCRKDGSTLHAQSNVAAMRSPTGEFLGLISVVLDISERLRTEEALRRLADELSEVDRRKDEFLATLAHELRNPLAPMRTAVELLRVKGPDIPELQWARDVIDRQTQAMTRLIDDLMDVSRINQGKVTLKREQVELAKIVQGAVETSQPLIEEMGHELTVTLPPRTVIVDADLTRLAQVILNLLNNAAKYTERGGRIDLRAELQGSDVVVSVTDTGIGIPADKLPTLFEMFSQVEGALSRSQGGLGIGLCLVKRLVEMHGGIIKAKSDGPGRGSEFVVRLPIVVQQTYARPASHNGDKAKSISNLRILVVDDNRDAAESLAMLLTAMGNNVHTAHDGEEAVAAAGKYRPDVVLCDIGLPKLNGYEACRQMKEQAWDKKMILIAVTGWGQDEDRRKSEDAGFDHHLVKPVDLNSLISLLLGAPKLLLAPSGKSGPLRVLIVDDMRDARHMLSTLLKASGHDVQTASDGLSAISVALDFQPNVVLMDNSMPGMSGLEVARQMRLEPKLKDAMLIALTGHGDEDDRQRSFEAGFNHHLVKPADISVIRELLGNVR